MLLIEGYLWNLDWDRTRKLKVKWNYRKSPVRIIFPAQLKRQSTQQCCQCFDSSHLSSAHFTFRRAFFNPKVLIFFLFLHKNICCGYSLEVPWRGASNENPQHMFSWRNKKNIYRIPSLIYTYAGYHSSCKVRALFWTRYIFLISSWKHVGAH